MAKNLRFLTALKSPYLRPNLPISKHKSPYLGQRRYHMYELTTFFLRKLKFSLWDGFTLNADSSGDNVDTWRCGFPNFFKHLVMLLSLACDLIFFLKISDKEKKQDKLVADTECSSYFRVQTSQEI